MNNKTIKKINKVAFPQWVGVKRASLQFLDCIKAALASFPGTGLHQCSRLGLWSGVDTQRE
jgi:hypothetical protein